MNNPLRDRIAAAMLERFFAREDVALDAADAVIEELTSPIRGCTDQWHWSTGEPFRCPSCGYWMGEGYVE